MKIKGTQSEKNLLTAFAGESQARNKYTYYAARAEEEGCHETAELFENMAKNETEHAKVWFKLLFGIKDTDEHLMDAASGEHSEWRSMYPEFAKTAREEGLEELAQLFERVAAVEQLHEMTFLKEFGRVKMGAAAPETAPPRKVYRCAFCGQLHEIADGEPPAVCPLCQAIGSFQLTEI